MNSMYKVGITDPGLPDKVAKYITKWVNIGCLGEGCWVTNVSCKSKGLEYGKCIADSLQMWVKDRICIGTLTEGEFPRLKLNGSFVGVLGGH